MEARRHSTKGGLGGRLPRPSDSTASRSSSGTPNSADKRAGSSPTSEPQLGFAALVLIVREGPVSSTSAAREAPATFPPDQVMAWMPRDTYERDGAVAALAFGAT